MLKLLIRREGLLGKGEHEFAFEFGLPVFATRQIGHSSVHDALAQFVGAQCGGRTGSLLRRFAGRKLLKCFVLMWVVKSIGHVRNSNWFVARAAHTPQAA